MRMVSLETKMRMRQRFEGQTFGEYLSHLPFSLFQPDKNELLVSLDQT